MADNLFKDSDPGCNVPEVPVVDFKFVEDCFIEPTPPPIFECIKPPIPNEPCINCPEFNTNGTISAGYDDGSGNCTTGIEVTVTKTGEDPCQYDFNVDVQVGLPRIPCPEINVTSFDVASRLTVDGSGIGYDPTTTTVCCPLQKDTFSELLALTLEEAPVGVYIRTKEPAVVWQRAAGSGGAEAWVNKNDQEQEECGSKFTITQRRTPGDCDTPDQCEFDVELKINVPVPVVPCPIISIENFGVTSRFENNQSGISYDPTKTTNCCPLQRNSYADLLAMTPQEAPSGVYVETLDPPKLWRKFGLSWVEQEKECGSKFTITPRHRPPTDCNDPGQCEFEIDLQIEVPIPRAPCPKINVSCFNVKTRLAGGGGDDNGNNDNDCCPTTIDVGSFSELTQLETAVAGAGSYGSVKQTNRPSEWPLFKRVQDGSWKPVLRVASIPDVEDPDFEVGDYVYTAGESKCDGDDRYWKKIINEDGDKEWQEISPPCRNRFVITTRHTAPTDCNDPGQCEFDIDLEINVPIPQPPCPIINTSLSVGAHTQADACCPQTFTLGSLADRDALDITQAPVGTYVQIEDKSKRPKFWDTYRRAESGWQAVARFQNVDEILAPGNSAPVGSIAVALDTGEYWKKVKNQEDLTGPDDKTWEVTEKPCINRFVVTATTTSATCDGAAECRFDIDLDLNVPIPIIPCPKISASSSTNVGYADSPCIQCIKNLTINRATGLEGISEAALKDGMYVGVRDVVSTFKLENDSQNPGQTRWVPAGYDRPVNRFTDVNDINAEDKPDAIAVVADPATLYVKTGDNWDPLYPPVALVTVVGTSDRDNLAVDVAPIGSIVKTTNGGGTFWQRNESGWTEVPTPTPSRNVNKYADLNTLPNTSTGDIIEVDDPPNRFQYDSENDRWNPQEFSDDIITVYEEGDLNSIAEDERTLGMVARVFAPVDRYKVTMGPDGPSFSPARCPQNQFVVLSRQKRGDCNTPAECIFDFLLELVVPIPVPPCPEMSSTGAEVHVGYENTPCTECISDSAVQDVTKLSTIPEGDRKLGMYVSVKNAAATFTLNEDLQTWDPLSFERGMYSTNELNEIPAGERDDAIVALQNPPKLYTYSADPNDPGGEPKWRPIYAPTPDYELNDTAARDNLSSTEAPIGTIVKIKEPATQLFKRTAANVWTPEYNPTPSDSVDYAGDLSGIDSPALEQVIEIKNPPDYFKYQDGEWVPHQYPDDMVTVHTEEGLNTIGADERTAGMTAKVNRPTDRYRLGAGGQWIPARCPQNVFDVIARRIKPKECDDPGKCIFDIDLEIVVPVPKPPCPEISIGDFDVVVGFRGSTKTPDQDCPDCVEGVTVDTPEDVADAITENELNPGDYIDVSKPHTRYQLSADGSTWVPVTNNAVIPAPDSETLSNWIESGSYETGDPEQPTKPLLPGQRVTVVNPDTLYKLDNNLAGWSPEREQQNVPPSKLITVGTVAELNNLPFKQRRKGIYAQVLAPEKNYTLNGTGTNQKWDPTVPDFNAKNIDELNGLPPEKRKPGMYAQIDDPITRFRVDESGNPVPVSCPQNKFRIRKKTTPGEDCSEPDQCEFEVDLTIVVPIPRIPCPIINVKKFDVKTHFKSDNPDDDTCCIPGTPTVVTEVGSIAERDELSFEEVPQGGYAKTADDKFWQRTGDLDKSEWVEAGDPNSAVCGSSFRVVPRHRSPNNCQDPGQCEFDIDLQINVPIPRIPCPKFDAKMDVKSGYSDSECISCESDLEVKSYDDLKNIPSAQLKDGLTVGVEDSVSEYFWDGTDWVPGASQTDSEPDLTVDSWSDVAALGIPTDGFTVEIKEPPTQFFVGDNTLVDERYVYNWDPLVDITCSEGPTFSTVSARDAYYAFNFAPWRSVCVTLTNPPTRYRYEARISGQLPASWVGLNTSNGAPGGDIVVKDENEMRALNTAALDEGTTVSLLNPTGRFKYKNGKWIGAPCPKSGITVKKNHRPPSDCNDTGTCDFELDIDIVVPIPRPTCPEMNVKSVSVTTVDKACVENESNQQDCRFDISFNTLHEARRYLKADLRPVGAPEPWQGMRAYVAVTDLIYVLNANTWVQLQKNPFCARSRFIVLARHQDNRIQKFLDSEEQLTDQDLLDEIEPGQAVATPVVPDITAADVDSLPTEGVEPGTVASVGEGEDQKFYRLGDDGKWAATSKYKRWRRGDGIDPPDWTEIEGNDDSECGGQNDTVKCIFDFIVDIKVPIPSPPCPELAVKIKPFVRYQNEDCEECYADVTIGAVSDLGSVIPPPVPNACGDSPPYYVKAVNVDYLYEHQDGEFSVIAQRDASVPPPNDDAKWIVAEFVDLAGLPEKYGDKLKNGDTVEVAFPVDRWRYSYPDNVWIEDRCPRDSRVGSKRIENDCENPEDQPKCALHFFVDIPILIPKPPCPEFETNIRTGAYYEDCSNGCTSDLNFESMSELLEIGPIGDGPDSVQNCAALPEADIEEGTTASVKANNTRWRWLTQHGGWVPAACTSEMLIIPKKGGAGCEDPAKCEFDVIVDIQVPIPSPPCPKFNVRQSEVNTCGATNPKSLILLGVREKGDCGDAGIDDCDNPNDCIFDFDFQLDIPCPVLRGGVINVWPVHPRLGVGGVLGVAPGVCQTPPPESCPSANHTVRDIIARDKKLYELAAATPGLQPGFVVRIAGGRGGPVGPGGQQDSYVEYAGGAECGNPRWVPTSSTTAAHTVDGGSAAAATSGLRDLIGSLLATASASLVGTVIKTQQPRPDGIYWTYLGGLEKFMPVWEPFVCPAEPKKICAFDFNAAIAVPFCAPSMEEDEFIPDPNDPGELIGKFTGVREKDRLRIIYLKPYEDCPIPGANCPDPDHEVDDEAAMILMMGAAPAPVAAVVNGRAGQQIVLRDGLIFSNLGNFSIAKNNPADPSGLPLIIENYACGGDDEPPCPADGAVPQLVDMPEGDALGKAPDPALKDNDVVQLKNGRRFRFNVAGGGVADPRKPQGFRALRCPEASFELIVVPDPNDICKMRYCEKIIICVRQPDHVALCTDYYGDPCCDTKVLLPCDGETYTCCDDSEKEGVDDGSKGTGIPPYYQGHNPLPLQELPRQELLESAEIEPARSGLPRLAAHNPDPPPAQRNDPCKQHVEETDDCPTDLPAPTDNGYRPFKSLELNIKEEFPPDRSTPPVIKYNLEAAMNYLHGSTVVVKKGQRPPAQTLLAAPETVTSAQLGDRPVMAVAGTSTIQPSVDDIGTGKIVIENNRISLEVTLYTAECGEAPAEPGTPPFQLKEKPELSPALLESFIQAINTNPALKAAIRNVVNQPD